MSNPYREATSQLNSTRWKGGARAVMIMLCAVVAQSALADPCEVAVRVREGDFSQIRGQALEITYSYSGEEPTDTYVSLQTKIGFYAPGAITEEGSAMIGETMLPKGSYTFVSRILTSAPIKSAFVEESNCRGF